MAAFSILRLSGRAMLAVASVAVVSLAGVVVTSPAVGAYPQSVVQKCRGDYNRLCPGYKLHSDDLRACMRSQHRSITNICMNALVDAGEAPVSARRR